jgi:hypothetical protein
MKLGDVVRVRYDFEIIDGKTFLEKGDYGVIVQDYGESPFGHLFGVEFYNGNYGRFFSEEIEVVNPL